MQKIRSDHAVTLRHVRIDSAQAPSIWGGNWASKLPAAIGIRLHGAALKEIPAHEEYTRSAMLKHQSRAY
ncbi:hypothetical protein TNCV_2184781 [Trichonephila clavipes]|nr:hypothetical protein TNCV_2184781 [Trichonephila clavipes]